MSDLPEAFSLLTASGLWGRESALTDGAFRVLMSPMLGLPVKPFEVEQVPVDDLPMETVAYRAVGPGVRPTEGEVDGEAWLVLDGQWGERSPRDTGLVLVTFARDIADLLGSPGDEPSAALVWPPLEVAVVRRIGDRGLGLVTRTAPPYQLAAPGITVLRIRGHVHDLTIAAPPASDNPPHSSKVDPRQTALGFPVGQLARYAGRDDNETTVWSRVTFSAPPRLGPHEGGMVLADPADAEQRRVDGLVRPWLRSSLRTLLDGTRLDSSARANSLHGIKSVSATGTDLLTVLHASATDIGIARWLGLADRVPRSGAPLTWIRVSGTWSTADPTITERRPPGAGHLLAGADGTITLTATAWVTHDVPPNLPAPPTLTLRPPPVWIRGPRLADDTALMRLEATGVAVLGSIGLAQRGVPPRPVHDDVAGRPRPRIGIERGVIDDVMTLADDGRDYEAWQSDAFGRWSATSTALTVPRLVPLGLPSPEPQIHRVREPGLGTAVAKLVVTVPIPSRLGGQPGVASVEIAVDGHPQAPAPIDATMAARVECECLIPRSLSPRNNEVEITAEFRSDDDNADPTITRRTVTLWDPGPPRPPRQQTGLHFATRAGPTGRSTVTIPLPSAPGIDGYHIELALEHDLPPASTASPRLSPGQRAAELLAKGHLVGTLCQFARLTTSPVDVSTGHYVHHLPGVLDELAIYRLIPTSTTGAHDRYAPGLLHIVAVPNGRQPSRPRLQHTPDQSTISLHVTRTAARGGPTEFRLRQIATEDGDLRRARIVRQGLLDDTGTTLISLDLEQGSRRTYVAEVRHGDVDASAALDDDAARARGAWSAPSAPLEVISPAAPPRPP